MSPSGLPQAISDVFSRWVGWGWGIAALVWLAGAIVILTRVQRYFLERTGSRRITIVILIVWSFAVIGVTAHLVGFAAPAG